MGKKLLSFLILFLISACSKVPAGHVGIKVNLLGTSKGVDVEELPVGRYWIGWNEELYLFPTFKQNYTWTKDATEGRTENEALSFQTVEGMTVDADLGITFHFERNKISTIFQNYRKGVDEIVSVFLRNNVRDAINKVASEMQVKDVYGSGKSNLISKVEKEVKETVEKEGIVVEKIYFIGSLRLPKTVIASLNSKIEATQRAQQRENELREAQAQAKKDIAKAEGDAKSAIAIARGEAESVLIKSQTQAKANKILAQSINDQLIEYEKVKKWNGQLPIYNGQSYPFMNIGKVK